MTPKCVHAQSAPGDVQALPPIVVRGPSRASSAAASNNATRVVRRPPVAECRLRGLIRRRRWPAPALMPTRCRPPLPSSTATDIARTQSLNIADALVQNVPAITVSEVAGNPFQPDVHFRGFDASPVSGHAAGARRLPERRAHQRSLRRHRQLGLDSDRGGQVDRASSATIPPSASTRSAARVAMQMKDGFNFQGTTLDLMGGCFGRAQSSLQWGKQVGNWAAYIAIDGAHDNGYRNFRRLGHPPHLRRHRLQGRAARVPHQRRRAPTTTSAPPRPRRSNCCKQNWGNVYTTPQTSPNQVGYRQRDRQRRT